MMAKMAAVSAALLRKLDSASPVFRTSSVAGAP